MKISKRQLRRIIKEEKRKLQEAQLPPMDPVEGLFVAVKDAVLELFIRNAVGSGIPLRVTDVMNHLRKRGLSDDEIEMGIEALGEAY